ncbi:MAG: hypothetical protein IPM92_06055 [Saprospiraceae bacterium]|nr:hypothetical protein [Saprospiraceae bacterium]
MKVIAIFFLGLLLACQSDTKSSNSKEFADEFYVDKNWIEVHFDKAMPSEKLVEIRERLAQLGIGLKYLIIQRDSQKIMTNFQIEVHDGKGSIARSRTEFLDEIPYGIRIKRTEPTSGEFKVGPLYEKRPQ